MMRLQELREAFSGFPAFLWQDRWLIAACWLTIVLAVITNAGMIWLIGEPFNLLQQERYDEVSHALMLFAVVVLVNQGAQVAGGLIGNHIGFQAIGRIRNHLLAHCLYLSFPVLGRYSRGDLLVRLSDDVDTVKATLMNVYVFLLSHLLTLAIYIFMLFWIDVELALWALAVSVLFLLHQRIFASPKRRAAEQFYYYNGRLLGLEEQLLANSRGISNYTAEAWAAGAHNKAFELARRWVVREKNIDVWFTAGFSLLIYLVGLLMVLLGIEGIRDGRFGLGHLVSFLLYLGYLTVPSRGLADTLFQAFGASAAARRIRELLQLSPQVAERSDARELELSGGEIRVQNLSFAFEPERPLFRDVSLQIAPGETVAIVGPSGAGKTTLAALLVRHYDPDRGRILVDGQDIRELRLASLRRAVSTVSQEPFLVAGTVRDNLLMARPGAGEAQLWEACRQAYAEEFLRKLPEGLDTLIGGGGLQLSAGQQQRLSLAQAFLRDTPVLIMDEATSALDSHSEQQVSRAMESLRQGRTTLLIAHRYSSLQSAGRVFYLNGDGSITIGRHEQLMASHEAYRQAVSWQTGDAGG